MRRPEVSGSLIHRDESSRIRKPDIQREPEHLCDVGIIETDHFSVFRFGPLKVIVLVLNAGLLKRFGQNRCGQIACRKLFLKVFQRRIEPLFFRLCVLVLLEFRNRAFKNLYKRICGRRLDIVDNSGGLVALSEEDGQECKHAFLVCGKFFFAVNSGSHVFHVPVEEGTKIQVFSLVPVGLVGIQRLIDDIAVAFLKESRFDKSLDVRAEERRILVHHFAELLLGFIGRHDFVGAVMFETPASRKHLIEKVIFRRKIVDVVIDILFL